MLWIRTVGRPSDSVLGLSELVERFMQWGEPIRVAVIGSPPSVEPKWLFHVRRP